MDGPDYAVLLAALRRQLRRLSLPVASGAFRQRAWREVERALDSLGLPRRSQRTQEWGCSDAWLRAKWVARAWN